jgi:lysophospholipase L1-like esterase
MRESMKNVLCYGDSLSWGIIPGTRDRYPYNKRWPGILQARLGAGVRIIEECLNGRTTVFEDPFRPHRKGTDLLIPILETHAPLDLVILFLGTNDLQAIYGASPCHIAQGASNLIDIIKKTQVENYLPPQVLLLSPPIITKPCGGMEYKFGEVAPKSEKLTRWYRELAQEKKCLFFDTATCIESSNIDGVHLDPEAHEQLANALKSVVSRALNQIS